MHHYIVNPWVNLYKTLYESLQILAYSLDDGSIKRILDLGIFVVKENLKLGLMDFITLMFCLVAKKVQEKKNPKNVEFYILWYVSLWNLLLDLV